MKKKIFIKTIFGLATLAFIFSATSCKNDKKNSSRKINVANTDYYVPYDFADENGNSTGFEVEVLKEVDKLLPQYEFVFHAVSDDELLIGVQTGKYQVGTKGVWFTEERSKKYIFPKNPIAASVVGITYRKSDQDKIYDLASFAKTKGKLVPIAPQSAQYNIVVQFNDAHPENPIELIPSENFIVSDAYTWLLEERYDAYFDIKLSFENNVANDNAPYHKFSEQLTYAPYKGIPTWPLFNQNEQQLADDYDNAIQTLKENGKLNELSLKWFGEDVFSYITE